ncbi:DUF4236 domain-containing protein [Sphingomonas sp.]|jgi:hypothetical protein|uniref:DUF4236 domain-containing protein n=1 Tax=Sphingomonas sp. TaxID=28214 RepID=UPI002DF55163|nr:DUF4236 domain-containing protein [Sphingomonas sp.]
MGFRFRRSVKLLPGVRLNFSTRGISTSIGGRGATMNISRRGVRSTFGIPGTGLSYTTPVRRFSGSASGSEPGVPATGSAVLGWIVIIAALLLIGSCIASLDSESAGPAIANPVPVTSPAFPTRTVSGSAVNCRAEPRTGAVLTRLKQGDELVVLAQSNGWSKVAQTGGFC